MTIRLPSVGLLLVWLCLFQHDWVLSEISDACLKAICQVEYNCDPNYRGCNLLPGDKSGTRACGTYQIRKSYYAECSRRQTNVGPGWARCAGDMTCAEQCVVNYMRLHEKKCTGGSRAATCEDYARLHSGGPNGCKNHNTDEYWRLVQEALHDVDYGDLHSTTESPFQYYYVSEEVAETPGPVKLLVRPRSTKAIPTKKAKTTTRRTELPRIVHFQSPFGNGKPASETDAVSTTPNPDEDYYYIIEEYTTPATSRKTTMKKLATPKTTPKAATKTATKQTTKATPKATAKSTKKTTTTPMQFDVDDDHDDDFDEEDDDE